MVTVPGFSVSVAGGLVLPAPLQQAEAAPMPAKVAVPSNGRDPSLCVVSCAEIYGFLIYGCLVVNWGVIGEWS